MLAQSVKKLATKLEDPSSILYTYTVEVKSQTCKVFSDIYMAYTVIHSHIPSHSNR